MPNIMKSSLKRAPGVLLALSWPIWKIVQLGGDIDFLMSLTKWLNPGMNEFVTAWGWVPLTALGFGWLLVVTFQEKAKPSTVLVVAFVLALIFSSFLLGRAMPNDSWTLSKTRVFKKWGIIAPGNLGFELDIDDDLIRFKNEYKIAVGCRVVDRTIEFIADPSVMWSNTFSMKRDLVIMMKMPPAKPGAARNIGFECSVGLFDKTNPDQVRPIGWMVMFKSEMGGQDPRSAN